jgi:hypothetical protein
VQCVSYAPVKTMKHTLQLLKNNGEVCTVLDLRPGNGLLHKADEFRCDAIKPMELCDL